MASNRVMHKYPLTSAAMDMGVNPLWLRPGTMVKSVGCDGRVSGSIKPFPGFSQVIYEPAIAGADLFRHVTIRGTLSGQYYRGFLVRTPAGGSYGYSDLSLLLYDSAAGAWLPLFGVPHPFGGVVTLGPGEGDTIDVTSNGPFLYITISNYPEAPLVVWYDDIAADFVSASMGPGADDYPAAPGAVAATAAGLLHAGTYLFSYRYYNSYRGAYSGISAAATLVLTGTENIVHLTIPAPLETQWDYVDIFRSPCLEDVGPIMGGIVYRESRVALTTTYDAGLLPDQIIISLEQYDPYAEESTSVPAGGVIAYFQGITFCESEAFEGFRWSSTSTYAPESFPDGNAYALSSDEGPPLRLIAAGNALYAMCRSMTLRIMPIGTDIQIDRLQRGYSLTSQLGIVQVGEDILYASPVGIGLLNTQAGQFSVLSGLDRLFGSGGSWENDLDFVIAAADSKLGAAFFINPLSDDGEAIVVWYINQTATMLKDCNFSLATYGPAIVTGYDTRAYFLYDNGLIVCPDTENSNHTMTDPTGTINGTTTGAGAHYRITDNTAFFDTSGILEGAAYVYVFLSSGTERRLIAAVSGGGTVLEFDTPLSSEPPAGTRYTVSPVPFEVVLPPVPASPNGDPLFERRRTTAIGVKAFNLLLRDGTDANLIWHVGIYRDMSNTLMTGTDTGANVAGTGTARGDDAFRFGKVVVDGTILLPSIGIIAAGLDFELTGAGISGIITTSRQAGE